jgi:hypothetical protein
MAEAGNEQARADAVNLQNEARGAALADSAIAAGSAFGSGMQNIDSSGIEGSGNMERNLQYGKSRSEAARDMEHAMMGQEAQGLGDSLVQSFGDLSQSKAGAMQAARGGSIAGNSAALSEGYRQTGAEVMKFQPSRNDAEAVVDQSLAAAEQNPALPGEEPGAQAPAEADVDMARRQTIMDEEARMAEQTAQAQQPAQPEPAQAQAAGDHYNALEQFLRTKRSDQELAAKMGELGITDEAMRQKIQGATMSGNKDWRVQLQAALGS